MEVNKAGKTAIFIDENKLYSISAFNENYAYLYNIYTPVEISDKIDRFNLNIEKLKKALFCISNEQQFIDLDVSSESLSYRDKALNINLRLIEDSVVALPKFNITAFKNFNFPFSTTISSNKLLELRRAMDFASETSKFYLSQEQDGIYVCFADKQTSYNDDIKFLINTEYTGNISENIYDTSIIKLVSRTSNDIEVKIGDNGVCAMVVKGDNSELNYITTRLKK
jgi:hypothetical protein